MTAQEKQDILERAGFEEIFMIYKRFYLWFNNFESVKSIWFIKGLTRRKELDMINATLKGTLSDDRFMLEVDGKIWIKYLKNGENTNSLRRKERR